jgi:hypothetical protein
MPCLPRKIPKIPFTSYHLTHSGYLHHSPDLMVVRLCDLSRPGFGRKQTVLMEAALLDVYPFNEIDEV